MTFAGIEHGLDVSQQRGTIATRLRTRGAAMLVIRVEVWPGGDRSRAREIGRAGLANISALAEVSDYIAVLTDDRGHQSTLMVRDHRRDTGFWPLLARAFGDEATQPVPEQLVHVAQAVADHIRSRA